MTLKKSTQAARVLGKLGGLKGGKARTKAKREAAIRNGKKGGRPPVLKADGISHAMAKNYAEFFGQPQKH